ncbi:MAG: POTRA domain-containing protein [Myxococcales bacterium]
MGTRVATFLAVLGLLLGATPAGAVAGKLRAVAAAKKAPAPAPPAAPPSELGPATETSSAPEPEPAASPPGVIGSVELHLSQGEDTQEAAALITLRPNTPLEKKDVRRTLERLYGTGRFADIVITAAPRADGKLEVVVEAESRTYVDRIDFEGQKALSEAELRKALAVPDRRLEYYPEFVEKLTDRLLAAYRRIGYTRARIDHLLLETEQKETLLTFRVSEGEPIRLVALHVAGDPQLPIEEIARTLGLAQGDVLNLGKLEKGIAALKARYREEAYYRARFGPPEVSEDEQGATVRLPVTAGPAVDFRFQGNDAFSDAELKSRLSYDPEEPLDDGLLGQLSDRLVLFYRLSGFAEARVRWSEVRGTDRKKNFIVFHVEEGAPLRVSTITFVGHAHFDAQFLRDRLDESLLEAALGTIPEPAKPDEVLAGGPPRKRARYAPEPASVWYEPAYQQALTRIVELYRADGFLSAKVEPPRISRDERTREAQVVIQVHEGPQTLVSEVRCPGAPDPEKACAFVALKKGKPLNSLDVENSRQAIQKALGREGYVFAKVEDDELYDADQTQAAVEFRIAAGPKVRVGRILVQGTGRTAEDVVRSALSVEEGALLDPEDLAQSQRNLVRLGIFKAVSLRMNAPEVPDETKDVFVTVDERATQAITLGAGYSFVEGPRFFLEYSKVNLFGRALQFSGRAKLNFFNLGYVALSSAAKQRSADRALGRRINLSLQYPRVLQFLPVETGVRLELIHELVNRPAFDAMRTGAILGADVTGPKGISAGLAAEVMGDYVWITGALVGLSRADTERLRFPEGFTALFSLRPSVSWDLRDDPANPHRGLLVLASTEYVTSLGGSIGPENGPKREPHTSLIKATLQANGYVPLWRRVVLALSLRGGMVFHLNPQVDSETPVSKRFFLGGATTMRGFLDDGIVAEDQRQILRDEIAQCDAILNKTGCSVSRGQQLLSEGGELFMLGRAELRFPITGALEGALFFDTGNLWLDQKYFDLLRLQLRYSVGAGIRFVTPIGPAALDVGINLTPDRTLQEGMVVPHFSIGVF